MQSEIVVAGITTAGAALSAVCVAFLSRAATARRDYSGPVMGMSEYCGRVRGAAAAALKDCVQALDQLQAGAPHERTSRQRDRLFYEAQFEEGLLDEIRPDVIRFNQVIGKLRKDLLFAGGKVDDMSQAVAGDSQARTRELADLQWLLRGFERSLDDADEQFEQSRSNYLGRQVPYPPRRAVRRLHKRARAQYAVRARNSEAAMAGFLRAAVSLGYPSPPDAAEPTRRVRARGEGEAPSAGQGPTGPVAGDPPPCGYCIWRCPHAPGANGAPGTAGVLGG
ncbi:hypothetical protein [Streptomyces sp. NPDC001020]